jgi:hypothetical protein
MKTFRTFLENTSGPDWTRSGPEESPSFHHKTYIDGHEVNCFFDNVSSEHMPHAYDISFNVNGRTLASKDGGMDPVTSRKIYNHFQRSIGNLVANPPNKVPISHITYESAASKKDAQGVTVADVEASKKKGQIMHHILKRLKFVAPDNSNISLQPSSYGDHKVSVDLTKLS